MEKSKNNPAEQQTGKKDHRYPYEFVILIGSLLVGGVILILKMVGLF